ncbi:peptidoglycan-binding protein [Lelliottia sp. V106_10]|uniref:peptidoglycan-binding protein n=1 Tax=Lelliottia wanjuensis TaxID=3050585 RepID=UPI00254B657E|nr:MULTISPECIES: peptidoglycan-binding protein [unclassified Lelliottia]MDK9355805.1 peptidoglycan-binding protein [Lelliottia sp. V106_16]MDK9374143.1 peptidoglycan-binding protein [Lelliottia sp. V106_10]MDK9601938.1 peptidoglycan-binding protein [Lelliottia sp. V106_5]
MTGRYHSPLIFPLTDSVGECGTNNPADVKKFQKTISEAGYELATRRALMTNGRCEFETIEAIRWYQRLLNLSPTGLLHPTDAWYMQLQASLTPYWRPQHTVGILTVGEGQITFDAEGVDYVTAVEPFRQHRYPFFSRVLHWPGDNNSGVTLGRGYDMGRRGAGEIFSTLRRAGIEEDKATICSKAAFLHGKEAGLFVTVYGPLVGEITHQQQTSLFRISYREKVDYAQNLYRAYQPMSAWMVLDSKVRDVVVDILYQGFHHPKELLRAATKGRRELITFIMGDTGLMTYESQRKRIGYLR